MTASIPLKRELAHKGVTHTVLWSRGVDTDLLRIRDKGFIPDPRPVFLYVGRVAVEKNIQAFLTLDLPGTKFLAPVTQTPVPIQGNPSRTYEIPDSI